MQALKRLVVACLLLVSELAHANSAPAKEAAAEPQKPRGPSRHYVHQWIAMPSFSGHGLLDDDVDFAPRKGRAAVIVFIASWCEPCQKVMPKLQLLEKRYKNLHTDFVYVFAHDTKEDAQGFMKEYGVSDAVLGNNEILKAYKNPELPTVYVGDRKGWMMTRYVRTDNADLDELDRLLRYVTAY